MNIMDDTFAFIIAVCMTWYNVYGGDLCPDGWTDDTANNRCIKVMDPVVDRMSGAATCKSCGGWLVSLKKPDDQLIVNDLIRLHDEEGKRKTIKYFIDLNDLETTSVWKFEDGENATWIDWDSDQPNGHLYVGGQHCITIRFKNKKWHDTECTGRNFHFICMRDAGNWDLIRNSFALVPSGCLSQQSPMKTFPSGGIEDCSSACSTEPCCTAFGSNNNQCILYGMDLLEAIECPGPSFQVYTKI